VNIAEVSARNRIIEAAAQLLAQGGREAVTVRAIMAAAGVQAPTIYRQFGDLRGLLEAVTSHGFSTYLHSKVTRETAPDPVDDLRRGWDLHVEFGLSHPALYVLMYGDPRPETLGLAALEAGTVLHGLVQRVAAAGRLKITVEQAAGIISATGIGVTLALIGTRPEERDPELSALTREAVLQAVTFGETLQQASTPGHSLMSRAVALQAVLAAGSSTQLDTRLSPGERHLLLEWLTRLSLPPGVSP
jgi:AcrR family transcriptional regulator